MRIITCGILFCFFSLCVNADDFIVSHVYSTNPLLKSFVEGIINAKVETKISISIVNDIAYIAYDSSKEILTFYKASADEGRFFFKKRKSHIVKLFMGDDSVEKEIYFELEKNGKRKMRVTLIRM